MSDVIGSYADQYGGDNNTSYTLYIKDKGQSSWYRDHELTLIDKNRCDLLQLWKEKEDREYKQKYNLNWVFLHGKEVIAEMYSASIHSLANCLDLTVDDMWGSHGEGFVYMENTLRILELAAPFLEKNDKKGWVEFCKKTKQVK